MKRKKLKFALFELVLLVVQIIFSNIEFFGFINSFGISFSFVRVFFNDNFLCVISSYFISKIILNQTIKRLSITCYEIVLMSLYYIFKEVIIKKKKRLKFFIFVVLSCILELYFSISSLFDFLHFLIAFAIEILSILFLLKFFVILRNKRDFLKFSKTDYLFFSVFTLLFFSGIFNFVFVQKYLMFFLITFISIFLCKVFKDEKYFISVVLIGCSAFVSTGNFIFLTITALLSVFLVQFRDFGKFHFTILCTIFLGALVLIFKIFGLVELISIFVAVILYLIIPTKFIQRLNFIFEIDGKNLLIKNVEKEKITEIRNKILLMSNLFFKMQNEFKYLLVGKIDKEKASAELSGDVVSKCCLDCENYRCCFLENINKKAMIENGLLRVFENKNLSFDEIKNGVSTYCAKSGLLANEILKIRELYFSYESAMKAEDESKLLISSEFGNFSNLFKDFTKFLSTGEKVNCKKSKAVLEKLLNQMIDVKEVMIFENEGGIEKVCMIASNDAVLKKEVMDTLKFITRQNFRVKNISHINESGLCFATFVLDAKMKINFAVSKRAKCDVSGDNSVISKIDGNKFFVAIADGMGHGKNANKISSMVLSLVQSFFEIGIDENLILDSVNKLLIPLEINTFTTLDACIIDLDKQVCTFVKLGSSVSVIKRNRISEVVSCKSLPIGIVKNIKPSIIRKDIFVGDTIVIASDGAVDSFGSISNFQNYVNDKNQKDLQKFADEIAFDAENLNKSHLDDITVMAINLLKN